MGIRAAPAGNGPSSDSHRAGRIWLHRYAVFCAIATFPLIFAGGLVTGMEAALAVPDWPTTYGQNMFTYPWSKMVGGIFYEHGHRLLGSAVGVLTVGLTVWLGFAEPRRWLRMLGIVALGAVVLQGILGGLRVTELAHWLAIPHACLAQTFFCLMAAIALFTSPAWQASVEPISDPQRSELPRVCGVATLAIYCQLVAGAVQRHAESLVGAALWIHLGGAVVVSALVIRAIRRVSIHTGHRRELVRPARIGLVLLAVQLLLGGGSFWVRWIAVNDVQPEFLTVAVTTLHVAVGALLLMTSLILTLQSYRLLQMPTGKLETEFVATGVVA